MPAGPTAKMAVLRQARTGSAATELICFSFNNSRFNPSSRSSFTSAVAAGFSAVSSLSPKKIEFAPAKKQSAWPSRVMRVRPAARRTRARGIAMRATATNRTRSKIYAGGLEFRRFVVADFTEGNADFHAELADFAHDFEHALEFLSAVVYSAPGCPHAKTCRSLCPRLFGSRSNPLQRKQIFAFDAGSVMGTLRAISAILAASTGLDAKQRTTLHRFAAPMFQMNRARSRNQIKEKPVIEDP